MQEKLRRIDFFRLRRIGNTYYYAKKGTQTPVSPDFPTLQLAQAWMKKNWKDLMFEEVVLR